MAQLIPPVLPTSDMSPGEIQVFNWLKNSAEIDDWIIFHSYDLPKGRNSRRHELDFLAIVPNLGLAVIEVKGHQSAELTADGLWRLGKESFPSKDPVKQVLDTCYSFRRHLDTFLSQKLKVAPLLVFTDAEVPLLAQLDPECQLSPRDGSVPGRIVERIEEAIRKEPGAIPSAQTIELMLKRLRPDFEALASPLARRERLDADLFRATSEQQRVIDAYEDNERILVEGPPGAGKTLLAIEAGRRKSDAGMSVRMLCFNTLLGRKLDHECADSFSASSFYQFLVSHFDERPPSGAGSSWWKGFAVRCATKFTDEDKVDFLIVDEAQDLMEPEFMAVLDAAVRGGLEGGKWLFVGDFEHQFLQNQGVGILSLPGNPAKLKLKNNCRNLRSHGEWLQLIVEEPELFGGFMRTEHAPPPQVKFSEDRDLVLKSVVRTIRESHHDEGVIVIVENTVRQEELERELGIKPFNPNSNKIGTATYRTFKGLEAPTVVVEASLNKTPDEIITAATRATRELIFLFPKSDQNEFIRRIGAA